MKVRGLWGLEIKPNKIQDLVINATVKITMASICQFNANSRTSIRMEFQESSFLLCSLIPEKIEQQVVDITCLEGEKIVFRSEGPNGIHLMGNYISQSDTESETDESEIEGRVEEEIPIVTQSSAVQKSNIKKQTIPIDINDDDSEDFGINDNLRGFKLQSLEEFLDTLSNDDESDISEEPKAHEEPATIIDIEAEGHNSIKPVDVAEELEEEKSGANTKSAALFQQVNDANIVEEDLKKEETSTNTQNVDSVKQVDGTAISGKDKVDQSGPIVELPKVINEQKCNAKSTRSKKKSKNTLVPDTLGEKDNKTDTASNSTDSQPPPAKASSKKSKAKKNKSTPPPTKDNKSNSVSDKQAETLSATKLKSKIAATPLKDTKKEPAPVEASANIEKNKQLTVEQPQETNGSNLVKSESVNKSGKHDATPEIAKRQDKSSNAKAKKSEPPTKDSLFSTNVKKLPNTRQQLQLNTLNKKPDVEIRTSSTHQYLDTPPPILPSDGNIPIIVEPKPVIQNVYSHQSIVEHTKSSLKYPFAKSKPTMLKSTNSHGIPVVQTSAITQEIPKAQWRQTSEGIPIVKTSETPVTLHSPVESSCQNVNTNNTPIPMAIPSAAKESLPQQKRYPKRRIHEDSARNLQKLAAGDSHMEKMVANEKKKRRRNRHKSPSPYSSTLVAPST